MPKMLVTDRDGAVHAVEGRVGVKFMEWSGQTLKIGA